MKQRKNKESGQVIFLVAFGLISLLAFTALAIDGGRLYSDRRSAQSTADTAAFSAALRLSEGSNNVQSIKSARARATDNGYDHAGDPNVNVDVSPVTYSNLFGTYYEVTVTIDSEIMPTFAQLIYSGPLASQVTAVARVIPKAPAGFGFAMYATSPDACGAITFSGTSGTTILGSGIFVNSNKVAPPCDAIKVSGNSATSIEEDILTNGAVNICNNCDFESDNGSIFENVGETPPAIIFPTPDCPSDIRNGPTAFDAGTAVVTFSPGIYPFGIGINGASLYHVFEPGMYCIRSSINGFKILNSKGVTGNGVMFYMENGDVSISGGDEVSLIAPSGDSLIDDSGNNWNGMLIYMPESNDGNISLGGNSASYFEGTIYAPAEPGNNAPKCKLTGNGATASFNTQLICYTITLTGTASLTIDYDGSNHYQPPSSIDLIQ